MKKKILGLTIAIFTLTIISTPVLAIGPGNSSGKNPNLSPPMPYGFDMLLDIRGNSHGIVHGWITVTPIPIIELDLDAGIFKIKNAFVVTDAVQAFGMENKWLYLSPSMQYDLLILQGTPTEMAAWIVSFHPDGVYMKWNSVGQ
jgi:hypothetical protein